MQQGFATHCVLEIWPTFNLWVRPVLAEQTAIWRTQFDLSAPKSFSQRCFRATLSKTVDLIAWVPGKRADQRNTWFITRRCPASEEMWAGKVLQIGRLHSPRLDGTGVPTYDIVVEVKWHAPCLDDEGNVRIDPEINVPLVEKQRADVPTRYYLARDIAPVVVVLPHPVFQIALCVLSRSFSFMRAAGWEPLRPVLPCFTPSHDEDEVA